MLSSVRRDLLPDAQLSGFCERQSPSSPHSRKQGVGSETEVVKYRKVANGTHQLIALSSNHKAGSLMDPQRPFSLDRYHVSEQYGFILPEPLAELPPYYQPWMDIAKHVPDLIQSHTLRTHIHQMPQLDPSFLQSYRELRLAHLALSMMTMGYVWQEGESDTAKVLPRNLAVPFWEVSRRVGLPAIVTHADGVLANWRKRDPEGPFDMENLELLLSLPGGERTCVASSWLP
ncbi:hypothetical protein SKAU_G00008700 [Synaphobranchus kaupii]|uniref:Uncharacterized protein n=1 Tax=Synaphobranchus kaupii TaxID=118154 RepID=A0A9Q1G9R6_SYNKA|nr:hypothetical protein SKAU_G00008700 [Synaphobranchus kaupii]